GPHAQSAVKERVCRTAAGFHDDTAATGAYTLSLHDALPVFTSEATNLVPGDTNGPSDVFVRDRAAGTTERISVSTGGAQGDSGSGGARLSAHRRWGDLV